MRGWAGGIALRAFAAIICLIALVWLALWYFIPAPPTSITMAAGVKGGGFEHFAELYREKLAAHHVTLNLRYYESGNENVRLLNDPKSGVSAALMFAGQTSSEESPGVVSLGRIDDAPLWIFYRAGAPIERLTQLKGKRLNISPAVAKLIGEVLAAHGVNAGNAKISTLLIPDAVKALRSGDLDVMFMPPLALNAPIVQSLLRDPGVGLMNVTQAEALKRMFPTVHRLVLPQGVVNLENNIPASDVNLLASSDVVVVRKDVHPELIYLLAQTLKEVHGGAGIFQSAGEFPTQTDPEYPMAEEAVDYYRNGPSFLHRYLPFWMINTAKRLAAILIAAVAVIIPIFTFAPRLYAWFVNARLLRLYSRLRVVNRRLKGELTADQVAVLQAELEEIDRAANILPMRHSDLFFSLLMHIDMTRTRLAARMAALPRLDSGA
jgi:TRAP-type uncharacterized transport system substrate-binding protein